MKPLARIEFIVSLWVVSVLPASATEKLDCSKRMDQYTMNQCSYLDFEKAENELNRVYRETMARLDADSQKRLRIEQRAWLKYREEHCEGESVPYPGSAAPALWNGCATKLDQQRAKKLRVWKAK